MKQTSTPKSYTLLIIALAAVSAGILLVLYTHGTSYAASMASGLSGDEKLALERPYSFSLTFLFLSLILLVAGCYRAFFGKTSGQSFSVTQLVQAGLLAALCYIGFTFFRIDITVGPEKTAFHFGNVFCVVAALLLGGYLGGLSGAVGMTIADLTTSYVTSAPKTFLLKLCIGLIVGLAAHKLGRLNTRRDPRQIAFITVGASVCGMLFNVIADPLVGYFYKTYLLGVPQDISVALAKLSALTTSVNAVVAVVAASSLYLALRPALAKAGLLALSKEDIR